MPSTQYNVTMINNAVKNYSRPQILDAMSEFQLEVYSENVEANKRIDPATGMPPFIVTVDGQRHYNCPSDCREVAAVFTESPERQYTLNQHRSVITEYVYRNTKYYKVAVTSTLGMINSVATITFVDNPGDTTTNYYLEYYFRPTNITNEQIQLEIPEETHRLFRKGVIEMLSSENYGVTGKENVIIESVKKKIRNQLNRGVQARAKKTPWREEDRDDECPTTYYST